MSVSVLSVDLRMMDVQLKVFGHLRLCFRHNRPFLVLATVAQAFHRILRDSPSLFPELNEYTMEN